MNVFDALKQRCANGARASPSGAPAADPVQRAGPHPIACELLEPRLLLSGTPEMLLDISSGEAPVAASDSCSVNEDSSLTVAAAEGVLANDYDADGEPLTAVLVDDVVNGTLTLTPAGSFTYDPHPDFFGTDSFTYVANDGLADSNVATVTITVNPLNDAPVADAGEDVNLFIGEDVLLQGTATDSNGDPVLDPTWSWTIDVKPAGSMPYLFDPTDQDPLFIPDLAGDYVLSLVVSDGTNQSLPDSITVHAVLNLPPVAIATADVTTGTAPLTVNFDGSQSYDPEGGPITYEWLFADASHSTEIAPTHVFDWEGTYLVKLKVVDDWGQITDDTLLIEVLPAASNPPVADAGEDVSIFFGESVFLHGTATDSNGDPVMNPTWLWTIDVKPAGSLASLSRATTQDPILFPDLIGDYVLSLVVSDGTHESLPDSITVHLALNLPPIAIATADVTTGSVPLTVNFDASQSFDPEGAPVTILWAFGDGSNSSEIAPTHVFERVDTYLVRMYVEDDWNQYGQDTLLIEVLPASNPPIADAGGPYAITEGDAPGLDASASSDADGDTLTFSWDLNNDNDFTDATGATPTLTWSELVALGVDDDGSFNVTVRVDDGNGGVDEASASLTIGNLAPTIALSGAGGVDEGSPYTVTLGPVTDPGDDTIVATGGYIVHWGDGGSDTYDAPGDVTHTYADGPATPTITVDLVDEDGTHTAAGSLGLTVNNVAPEAVIDSIVDDAGQVIGQDTNEVLAGLVVHLAASFSDAGILDTHTGLIDWGDGEQTDLGAVGAGPLAASHSYAAAGTYTITVTITDDDGDQGQATYQMNVVDTGSALSGVIAEIGALATDPSLDPAVVAALQNALGELQGQDGGDSSSGAQDMLAQENHNAAFVKILKAMDDLNEAEQADPSLDLTHLKRQLALVAKSLSVDVILLAETLADSQNDENRIADAYEDMLAGQAFLDANEFEEAVNSFLDALRAVNSIV